MTKFLFFFIFLTTGIFAQENNRIIIKLNNDVKLSTDGITGILAVDDVCREHKIIKAHKLDMGKGRLKKLMYYLFP